MTKPVADRTAAPPDLHRDITGTLDKLVSRKRLEFAVLGPDVAPLFDLASRAVAGGKRLRPAFAYWGWRAAGGSATDTEAITTAAAAVELVHASALIHDDVIDGSAMRRGRRSTQREFAAFLPAASAPASAASAASDPAPHQSSDASRAIGRLPPDRSVLGLDCGAGTSAASASASASSLQFGSSAAILLGDLLLSWSDELLATSGFKPKVAARGRRYFDLLRGEVVAGQYLDVLGQASGRSSAADAMRVVRYKSAKYTVERPLQFGAALAKAGEPLLAALSSYGVPLGEAFQLRDDVLGVFGETEVTGKPSGDDLREGKRTLLLARAFDQATAEQAAVLKAHVGDPTLDSHGICAVQQVLRDTGALTNVESVIAHLKAAALAALDSAPIIDREAVEALRSLADQATDRSW